MSDQDWQVVIPQVNEITICVTEDEVGLTQEQQQDNFGVWFPKSIIDLIVEALLAAKDA